MTLITSERRILAAGGNGRRATVIPPTAPTRDTPPGDTYENAPLVNFVHRQTAGTNARPRCAKCADVSAKNIRS